MSSSSSSSPCNWPTATTTTPTSSSSTAATTPRCTTGRALPYNWSAAEPAITGTLNKYKLPRLTEDDAFLLYLILLMLYDEGVTPTAAEILFKLKEHNATADLCQLAFVYYWIQKAWYRVETISGADLYGDDVDPHRVIALLKGYGVDTNGDGMTTLTTAVRPLSVTQDERRAHKTDMTVLFIRTPGWWKGWVDLKDRKNFYAPQIWVDFLDFFIECSRNDQICQAMTYGVMFNNTRYALAKALKAYGPDSIRTLRLGDVAHLVQLAIQQGYLVYQCGTIQPAWTSSAVLGAKSFKLGPPPSAGVKAIFEKCSDDLSSTTVGENHIDCLESGPTLRQKLEVLREHLAAIMEENPRVLLSQVRDLVKIKSGVSISPTDFGYAKLSDLLMDQASDICTLVRLRNRHVFAERVGVSPSSAASATRSRESAETPTPTDGGSGRGSYHLRAVRLLALNPWLAGRANSACPWLLDEELKMREWGTAAMARRAATEWSVEDYVRLDEQIRTLKSGFPPN